MDATPSPIQQSIEEATFGGGCFWCVETVFNQVQGVIEAESGYCNGHHPHPRYDEVCSGTTGHAEVVQVRFDPHVVSYEQLLQVFFAIHDPTTLNRQGNDVGPQYRSVIFTHDEAQKQTAQAIIAEFDAADLWPNPIVTEITPLDVFYRAEDYHQDYFKNNPYQPYCHFVVAPKVAKFRKKFSHRRKSSRES